jgi:methylisocitrate lyase
VSQLKPGARFSKALASESPLQIVGTINANHALMAKRAGYKAIYLSGGGVAAGSLGIPDLGITTLADVVTDATRITDVCDLPLLVDVDTGFGASAFNIARTVKTLEKAGAKRCGHRPNKEIVSKSEMVDRIKAAVDARNDSSFLIMARTDSLAKEGLSSAIDRMNAYVEAGADLLFPEAVIDLSTYKQITGSLKVPVLANITEFGVTPLFSTSELAAVGVQMALYPLSAFRAMNKAAENIYETIRREGTQKSLLNSMQTREELYERIDYYKYENALDKIFGNEKVKDDE